MTGGLSSVSHSLIVGWRVVPNTSTSSKKMALAVLRPIVFVAGLFFGCLLAATAAYFGGGGGPTFVRLARIVVPLLIGLAAPIFWVLSVRTRAGSRWITGYIVAWLVLVGTSSVLIRIF